jgi:hypothetical protein
LKNSYAIRTVAKIAVSVGMLVTTHCVLGQSARCLGINGAMQGSNSILLNDQPKIAPTSNSDLTVADKLDGPAIPADVSDSGTVPTSVLGSQVANASSNKTIPGDDDRWHLAVSPYLWFAGVHGTVGALGRTASVHASASDVLSKFNIGLMGAAEARKKRLVIPIDFMWIKLSDDKALPELNDPNISSIKVKVTQTLLTPKIGYRFIDTPTLQADAVVGLRYWHLGQNFSFQPSGVLSNYSQAANWVDFVAGAKVTMPLSTKAR